MILPCYFEKCMTLNVACITVILVKYCMVVCQLTFFAVQSITVSSVIWALCIFVFKLVAIIYFYG